MRASGFVGVVLTVLWSSACASISGVRPAWTPTSVDAEAARALAETGAQGLAVAVVEDGRPTYVRAYGVRNVKGEPLTHDSIMYGASITKAAFAYMVMQLVEEGVIGLDTPIDRYLPQPLTSYTDPEERYADWDTLAGDERWRKITPRMLLTHSAGFSNFFWLNPDKKLHIFFEPGARYSYSGDGYILMQFVLERGLGLDVGREMQRRVFDRFGMTNTDMMWRPAFARNMADGWDETGKTEPHDERSRVRAAGSMDTTIADMARFAAGYVRGEGLSREGRSELTRPQLPIDSASQFPVLQAPLPEEQRRADLAAGLGVIVFEGPQGRAFLKGGHNDTTRNMWLCVERGQRCVVLLANDARAERAFPRLVRHVLGETGAPWAWNSALPEAP